VSCDVGLEMEVELLAGQIDSLASAARAGAGRAVVVHARVESHVVRIRHGRPAQTKRRRRGEPCGCDSTPFGELTLLCLPDTAWSVLTRS
jgi:hypothetical protein